MHLGKRNNSNFLLSILLNLFFCSISPTIVHSEINVSKDLESRNLSNISFNEDPNVYRLGPGDSLNISFVGLPDFSRVYTVDSSGKLFLPEIKYLSVKNLSIKELRNTLYEKYEKVLIKPNIDIRINQYRPVRVYIIGEVSRPGFYTVQGTLKGDSIGSLNNFLEESFEISSQMPSVFQPSIEYSSNLFPTVFDIIKASQGVTPYTDLSDVKVIRKVGPKSSQKIEASLNFLSLITEGDHSQNIRIFDGDTIIVSKSKTVLKQQIANSLRTNLSPDMLKVYVTGNVVSPGIVTLPSGSGLNQAVATAGGKKILSGNIEFLRFNDEFDIDKRSFSYNLKAQKNSYKNPLLMNGDIINVRRSIIGNTAAGVAEVSKPIVGIYSLYNLFYD